MFKSFKPVWRLVAVLNLFFAMAAPANGATTSDTISRDRIKEIAEMLPQMPRGPGEPIGNRQYWSQVVDPEQQSAILQSATRVAGEPIPDQPDELYLEYSRNGNRTNWQNVSRARRSPLEDLVLAECLDNKGTFLPAIEDRITTLCAERTWVLPAHDKSLQNFRGTTITLDLGSSSLGWNLAMTDYLLGEKLNKNVRSNLRKRLQERIIKPYRSMIRNQRTKDWWIQGTNNWNAVCHAGVIGTALIELKSRDERAELVAAAEHYISYFLSGFTPDGYCSEGLGYWNYGFGHYVLLSEIVRDATAGKVDMLLDTPEARQPALFGNRIQIIKGIAPAFADCPIGASPSGQIMWMLQQRMPMPGKVKYGKPGVRGLLGQAMLITKLASEETRAKNDITSADDESIRTWFDKAGVLICRPTAKSEFAAAMKGGNNAEHHNHNDLGSYAVVLGDKAVLLDPGSEIYTARTFSPRRYDSKLLNSYGHPVPIIGGQLQRPGAKSSAEVTDTLFTSETDRLRMDITSAYKVDGLQKLEREFTYWRTGPGLLVVRDDVQLTSPQTFGTALITLGRLTQVDEKTLNITDGKQSLRVEIDAGQNEFAIKSEEIKENAAAKPTRIGIDLREPVTSASITLRISPAQSRDNKSW